MILAAGILAALVGIVAIALLVATGRPDTGSSILPTVREDGTARYVDPFAHHRPGCGCVHHR